VITAWQCCCCCLEFLFSSAFQSLGNEICCLYFPCVCVTKHLGPLSG
jgi:hypothetical protein